MKGPILAWLAIPAMLTCAFAVLGNSVDLVVDPDNISFSDTSPMEGDTVTITAAVRNQGDADIKEDIEVRFVEGDPQKGGLQISSDVIVLGLDAGATGEVRVKWRAAPGRTEILVTADPDNLVKET